MTDINESPEPNPAVMPTAPLPTAPPAAPVIGTTPPVPAQHPAHPHGVHVQHSVSEGVLAAVIIGSMLFAVLAFGVGWHARSIALHFQTRNAGIMGQSYGQGFGSIPGHPGLGRRGGMRGGQGRCYGQGYGQGQGQGYGYGQDQGQGYDQGQGQGQGPQLPPGHPDIGIN